MSRIVQDQLGEQFGSYLEKDHFFVDFLREPPEATGDEPEDFDFSAPKIYEPIPSLDVLKERLIS